ncbi:MAG: hypothetical protein JOZ00_05235 [Mycobacterium sp.]|uniref:DUF7159 family protein n=1 Tax=Mycobacterium sp. TaxID=1785 RepID=UPI001EC82337|nr:hypothetical protein [Mycobacterium sp.]MBV8786075.1 hypothetical protein [Mycobacterium sp.]
MDIVLGVSMAPASVQMVLLQGENADGATVDESEFTTADDAPTVSASDRVIAAIMGTREDAASAGLELGSIGVACTDQLEAAAIRDALAARKIENVMLVSTFLAATALTQFVGGAMGYERTALLFLEPDTATLAVVDTADGSVDDVHSESGDIVTAALMAMVAGLDELPTRPGGLFVLGSGVDIAPIKARLEEATSLTVSVPEEPETALARGAALASAHTLASPTGVLAYAQDPGTGVVDVSALPEYLSVGHDELGDDLAYSAVADDEADAQTVVIDARAPRRRPRLLVGTALVAASFGVAVALEIALSLGIRTTVGSLPAPIQSILAPVEQVLAPAPGQVAATKLAAPKPLSPPPSAPPPAAPVPAASPVPLPAAPPPPPPAAPVPVVVPPIAPVPLPPVHLPNPPVSPPVVEPPTHPSPPAEPPPIHVTPPKAPPPPHRPPPQGPPPNSGGGGPVAGPGHGNPSGGGPHGGGPADGPSPGHGTPGGGPPEGGAPPSGGGSTGGSESHGGGGPVSGGGADAGGSHGGGEVGGGSSGGSSSSGGGSSSSGGGGESSGGGHH